ncbi:MAG: M28 family peptidase, partial [Inquilinus sp.]|nr:M28 family peptidase [Inquilinus sp.]
SLPAFDVSIDGGDPNGYAPNEDFGTMTYSGSRDVTAGIQVVDVTIPPLPVDEMGTPGSTSGCEIDDFTGFVAGNIALIQRGACTFLLKAQNAEASGAVGVIIFNEGRPGRTAPFRGTLGEPSVNIPVIGTSYDIGTFLVDNAALPRVRLKVDAEIDPRETENVIAETRDGNPDQTIVVGAHLDSVGDGPGVNDNGSGSAAILEVAIRLGPGGRDDDDDDDDAEGRLQNRVRFAWWGAEEFGLLGSEAYVDALTFDEYLQIAMNLNFDMVGSPNFVRFVYDGDGSDTVDGSGNPVIGPSGSGDIEALFVDYLAGRGLASEPTLFSGRSDYGPFIDVGIPAGGLFTGAEGVKTVAEAETYGGTAGRAYDPCYHQSCDTIENNSDEVLDQFADAIAHSVAVYSQQAELFPQPPAVATFAARPTVTRSISKDDFEYWGSHLQR